MLRPPASRSSMGGWCRSRSRFRDPGRAHPPGRCPAAPALHPPGHRRSVSIWTSCGALESLTHLTDLPAGTVTSAGKARPVMVMTTEVSVSVTFWSAAAVDDGATGAVVVSVDASSPPQPPIRPSTMRAPAARIDSRRLMTYHPRQGGERSQRAESSRSSGEAKRAMTLLSLSQVSTSVRLTLDLGEALAADVLEQLPHHLTRLPLSPGTHDLPIHPNRLPGVPVAVEQSGGVRSQVPLPFLPTHRGGIE